MGNLLFLYSQQSSVSMRHGMSIGVNRLTEWVPVCVLRYPEQPERRLDQFCREGAS